MYKEDTGEEDGFAPNPGVAGKTAEEELGGFTEVDDFLEEVNGDGVDTDDFPDEAEPILFEEVDETVEEGEEEEAPTGGPQDEGAGPEVFDDGEEGVEESAQEEGEESGGDEADPFDGGFLGRDEPIAGEGSEEDRHDGGPGGEPAFVVTEAVVFGEDFAGEVGAIEVTGEVSGRGEVAGDTAGGGDEAEDEPVSDEGEEGKGDAKAE